MSDIDIQCVINGLDVTMQDSSTHVGYELEATTRATRQEQWRKITAASPFVEGTYDVVAVRENITETISIFVRGSTHSDMVRRLTAITDAIASPSYPVVWRVAEVTETWDASFADYTINSQREFNFATMCQVTLSMPRRPRVSIAYGDNNTTVSD